MQDNSGYITISVDCAGGDNSPNAMIDAMVLFLSKNKQNNVRFLLFGNKNTLENKLNKYKKFSNFYKIIDCDKKIDSNDKPSVALRKGKESTMWLAIESVKNKDANACISAGNTGALMALSKLILRPLNDIDRPALIQQIPTENGKSVTFLDLGANIDCTSENLYQFAIMGKVFSEVLTDNEEPKIGLLNIGTEEIKGLDVIKNTSSLLKESILKDNYVGFVEGNDLFNEKVDVVVTDGWTGNIALKAIEGTSRFVSKGLKRMFLSSLFSMIGLLFSFNSLRKFRKTISSRNYNGALFIGLNGISVKSHGNADKMAFYCAIKNTIKFVEGNINEKIIDILKKDMEENTTENVKPAIIQIE